MHWAWAIRLSPAPKLVLMALADEANDGGFCFPSVAHLAQKCSIGERTVQRILRQLTQDGLVGVEQRFRKDRARTSNGYRLGVADPPSNWHRPGGPGDVGPVTPAPGGRCHPCHPPGVTGDGVTTTEPCIDPTPLRPTESGNTLSAGQDAGLCFPKGLSVAQRQAVRVQLRMLNRSAAQCILDELAGRMLHGEVRSPVRYCAALVRCL